MPDSFDPSLDWLTTCNACEVAPMLEGDPAGYCAECKAAAVASTCESAS